MPNCQNNIVGGQGIVKCFKNFVRDCSLAEKLDNRPNRLTRCCAQFKPFTKIYVRKKTVPEVSNTAFGLHPFYGQEACAGGGGIKILSIVTLNSKPLRKLTSSNVLNQNQNRRGLETECLFGHSPLVLGALLKV